MTASISHFHQRIDGCFADRIGTAGLSEREFKALLDETSGALEELKRRSKERTLPLLALPQRRDDLPAIRAAAERLRRFEDVAVLGTGGSSLGGRTLTALADGGLGPAGYRHPPRLWFVENVDPDGFEQVTSRLDPARLGLVIISKSGGTAETLSQALALLPRLTAAGAALPERAVVITEPADNPLRRLAERHRLSIIDHDPGVGGRFSVLSPTGLLPAANAGLDVAAIREGAGDVLRATLAAPGSEAAPPAIGAALNVALARHRGVSQSVMMPYVDRLAPFAQWFCQLWAESLGKDGKGTTPIRAQGTVDQHSQLQLYNAGPGDKLFTLVLGDHRGRGPRFDDLPADAALDWLRGHAMGDLMAAFQHGTAETLSEHRRPVRLITLDRLDERVLGALLMHFMLETIIAAHLFQVNPFDQPAVEDGKRRAREHLARR